MSEAPQDDAARDRDGQPFELRLALTIPGAVSLGAYEAGVAAALVVAARAAGAEPGAAEVTVDAIGASSAGSVLGLLLARCVVEGLEPVELFRRVWVESASLAQVLARGLTAPLDFTRLSRDALALLEDPPGRRASGQRSPVHLSVGLGNLRGLAYRLPSVSTPDYAAVTHLDWFDFTVEPDAPLNDLTTPAGAAPLDAVLASAANQLGFAARVISRRAQEAEYRAAGVVNFPESGAFWYTDAAFLDREPITRALRTARQIDAQPTHRSFQRAHVVIEPQPVEAAPGAQWADPAVPPSWLAVLRRCAAVLQAQTVFDDLSGVDDNNRRLAGVEALLASITPLLAGLSPSEQERWRSALAGDAVPDEGQVSVEDVLRRRLSDAADVAGKRRLQVEVISPELVARGRPADQLLAGRAFFRFGGFLDERLRRSDFDTGYASTTTWLAGGAFQRLGLPDGAAAAGLRAAEAAYRPVQDAPTPTLSFRARLQLGRLAARLVVVGLHDLVVGRRQRRRARRV